MTLQVSSTVVDALLAKAAEEHPRECCGILTGEGATVSAAIPAQNVHPRPEAHFEIDPKALIDAHRSAREGGPQVVGYYHSHPNGFPGPSSTDRDLASGDGMVWAIVAAGRIECWRAGGAGFEPLPYVVRDG